MKVYRVTDSYDYDEIQIDAVTDPILEEVRERTWNLCKQYDGRNRRRWKVLLQNFVTHELEMAYGAKVENDYRDAWLAEVEIFCMKYGYAE